MKTILERRGGRIVIPNIILPGLDFREGLFLEW
jgi:hypothetical protein